MAQMVVVATTEEVPPGKGIVVDVNGKGVALFNVDGSFYALDNTCLHRGGPVGEGFLDSSIVTCPWHGWQYDVKTGAATFNPSVKLDTYRVEVEGNEVKIAVGS